MQNAASMLDTKTFKNNNFPASCECLIFVQLW